MDDQVRDKRCHRTARGSFPREENKEPSVGSLSSDSPHSNIKTLGK